MSINLRNLATNPTVEYLGDGVYATFDGYQIWLHVSNGLRITNQVALEPTVFDALRHYENNLQTKPEAD